MLHERLEKIDELNATIDRLREQNRRMTVERTQAQSQA